jgi:uncharacterized glyoxalase superfamily protein PhnB
MNGESTDTSPAGLKLRVLDAKQAVDYFLRTHLFEVIDAMPGTGGAYIVRMRSVAGITPIELIIEQPHESRLENWTITTGLEISLKCRDINSLDKTHRQLREAGVMVTDLYDRPWGGQFWLQDANGNYFMFMNESGEWIKE